ncbi:retrovirus-related pol polyprotein from transposon TNT 1-94 [Tanacetum coccineum]
MKMRERHGCAISALKTLGNQISHGEQERMKVLRGTSIMSCSGPVSMVKEYLTYVKFDGGIDYEEAFDHVARLETIRMIIAIAAQYRWKIHQMDMKSAFLNGLLEEDVYVEQPEGYVAKGPRSILLACLYMDDLIFTKNSQSMIDELKKSMTREFEMTDIGLMSYYLGIEVKQRDKGIFICQERYANEILKMFGMDKCNPIGTPIENKTKPLNHKTEEKGEDFKLVVYSDSDWARSKDDGRSTSEFLFFSGNNAFTWSLKKQPIVTLSSGEAYYLAAISCACHSIWLRIYHDRSKHINTRYHYIRECIARKDVRVIHTSSEDQLADIFTKSLDERDFTRQRMMFGVGKSSLKGGVGS